MVYCHVCRPFFNKSDIKDNLNLPPMMSIGSLFNQSVFKKTGNESRTYP